ncbi:MAG: hypothetical protein ACW97P_01285 [Candidatus Hodarchaeales archaeon]
MLKRKNKKWFEVISTAIVPLNLDSVPSVSDQRKLIRFIEKKIDAQQLNGYIAPEKGRYIPSIFIQSEIQKYLRVDGIIDICNLIDSTDLPGNVLEEIIYNSVQDIDGFFDLIKRRFFTKGGAISFLLNILGKSTSIKLKYLLNQILWEDEQLEAVLDLLASRGLYSGYIDPINQRVINFSNLSFSKDLINKKAVKTLAKFIQVSFQISSEASLVDISNLTRLNIKDCFELLKDYRSHWSYVKSFNGDSIFPIIEVLTKIVLDLYVYKEIPLDFWVNRLDIEKEELYNILLIINAELKGMLDLEEIEVPSIINWLNEGIDVEGLAEKLFLTPIQVLTCFKRIFKILNLRMIAGDTSNPFLVKGTEDFDIFCQIDTSSHTNPDIYFECQNCRRIMCSNCRNIDSTHECPFCGNISAFIIDLPRFCTTCETTFTFSYNLETTEECYFCKIGPLKPGWPQIWKETNPLSLLEQEVLNIFLNAEEFDLLLADLVERVSQPSDKVVRALENLIIHQKLKAQINIKDMKVKMDMTQSAVGCAICNTKTEEKLSRQCTSCNSRLCSNCYSEMEIVGMISCPECGEKLKPRI